MKALIVSGGSFPSKELLLKELEDCDYIIGVDRGIELLHQNNITPDIVVGDFDSVNKDIVTQYLSDKSKVVEFPKEKDFTDTHLALVQCIELDIREVVLLGCIGSRLDHTMANIGLLYFCLQKGLKAYIKDDHNIIFIVDSSIKLEENNGTIFSLLPFGGLVKKLNIKGAKYPLIDHDLKPWESITVSNEFIGSTVNINFDEGILIVIYSKD